jgi:hypothetical protein
MFGHPVMVVQEPLLVNRIMRLGLSAITFLAEFTAWTSLMQA